MKSQTFLLLASLFAIQAACGDTVTLKDGTKLEGTILREDREKVVIRYNVNASGSIREEKTVLRKDISDISKPAEDEAPFKDIEGLYPTPDLLTTEDYDARILKVRTFLSRYPKGSKAKEAENILNKLTAESKEIAAGGRKISGLIVSPAEYNANAYDIDASVAAVKIDKAAKSSNYIEALRSFTILDTEFPASEARNAAVPKILAILRKIQPQVTQWVDTYDARMEKRNAELEALTGPEAEGIRAANAQKDAQIEARYQAEKTANQTWVTPHPDHKGSIDDLNSAVSSEITRLSAPPEEGATDPGKAYRTAWKAIRAAGQDEEAVNKAYSEAQSASLPEKYLKILAAAAAESGVKVGS